ncbi:zinc finger, CCHC-type containing protein [Tanacetum coccineum]|uniref:Zinc finger, CCHC-type containing protein n=1 Tax=Tanacetum coccineum TaxID=301880 RepID=A0ABQ5FX31_9ASTR
MHSSNKRSRLPLALLVYTWSDLCNKWEVKMTTSSTNNSVFRGFFEKQKLTGPNFIDWYRQLRIVLSIEDKLNYLEQPLPPAPVAPAGQHVAPEILAAHTAWVKGSKEIVGLMLMTMEPEIQRNLENLHANDMLKELKALFAQQAEQELLQTTRDFHAVNRKKGSQLAPYYNMHSLGKTVNELHAMLKLHEQTLNLPKNNAPALHAIRAGKVQKGKKHNKPQPSKAGRGQNQGNGKNKHAYAPKPKIPPSPKREDPAKDSIGHECGETGHWKRNCPQYLAELLKKKKNTALCELWRSWIYDTSCGTHICNTTQGLRASRKLKPGALSLYVGNGQREAVEAIGNFDLSLPSGLVIVLNNCHYAPSITRGVISVSRLYEDGFINRFVNNTIQVSRNNMVYFSAIPRDGIFEIDLFKIYANENSIYTVSNKRAKLDLDSALLWHCRLGHISKKRIEKLQHDGLLNSTDLRAFEKCVPCMSGKMARKPYTHQVERAKDLLGLIHHRNWGSEALVKARYSLTKPDEVRTYVLLSRIFLINQEARWSLEDLEIIQKKIYIPFYKTLSLNHEEDDLEIDEPQSDIIPIRSGSLKRRLTWMEAVPPINLVFVANGHTSTPQNPGDLHWTTVKNILKYLRNTKDMFLVYGGDLKRELRVSCYTDAGYLTDADDLKSQTGYVFVLNGGAVDWKSAKQSIFATSSAEAEYIAAFDASKEAVWVRKFISGLGVVPTIEKPINMYCDNTGAILASI